MKSYATPFAVAGALLIAVLLTVLNLITTPQTLWFVYPVFAVAWWPIGVYLCRRKRYLLFACAGSLLTLAFIAAVNILTSPQNLWFLYAVPALLCLPAGVYLKNRMCSLPFALSIAAFIIAYYVAVNILLTPGRFWAAYPIFVTLWWPMSLYFTGKKQYKAFSVFGALWTIAFFTVSNVLTSVFPWAMYTCFPVLLWPTAMFFGKKLGGFKFSVFASLCILLWYAALNVLNSPGSPWAIFIAFPVLWWPLSVGFFGRHKPHIYALVMSALSIAFFIVVNIIYSPGTLWAFYPAFALLWWPMTLLFARKKAWRGYSFAASAVTIGFLAAVNVITSPGFAWSVFPSLGILWWPLAMSFKGRRSPLGFAAAGTLLAAVTLLTLNLMTSTSFLWSVFPILGLLWWPAAVCFVKRKSAFGFSVAGSLLATALVVSINLMTSPSFLWSVFVSLALLWWPAAVYFAKRKSAFGLSVAGSVLATALLVAINLMTSPGFPWCVFAVFALLWWPLSVYFHVVRRRRLTGEKA